MPVEPPPSAWGFPPLDAVDVDGLVGLGADLEPGTLLAAYRSGIFPMPITRHAPMAWWSPDPRGVLLLDGLRVSRSLRQSYRRLEIRVDTAFDEVLRGCADTRRPGGWITRDMRRAYGRLRELGWAHSVEAWTPDGRLAGGLYGVAIGGLFAGESMFHVRLPWGRDASKVALLGLVEILVSAGNLEQRLVDVQWRTEHLATLGVVDLARDDYLRRLEQALPLPLPVPFE